MTRNAPARTAPLPHDYERLTGEEKQAILWRRVVDTRYPELPALDQPGGLLAALRLTGALVRHDRRTYALRADVREPRTRLSHPFGVVAKAELVAVDGARAGGVLDGAPLLVRLAISGDPAKDGFAPAMSVKFFIKGFPAVNLQVAASIDGQGADREFFRDPLSNILPPPRSAAGRQSRPLLAWLIGQDDPFRLDLDHLVFRDRSGAINYACRIPHRIEFRPRRTLDAGERHDFRAALMSIPPGSALYDVWLNHDPAGAPMHVGAVVTTSEFVASEFGDRVLHFHHRRRGFD